MRGAAQGHSLKSRAPVALLLACRVHAACNPFDCMRPTWIPGGPFSVLPRTTCNERTFACSMHTHLPIGSPPSQRGPPPLAHGQLFPLAAPAMPGAARLRNSQHRRPASASFCSR
eukprot:scaffold207_cov409-Prasinococcus_capsulatus_cf.AAC.9